MIWTRTPPGVCVDDFGVGAKRGMQCAHRLGCASIQLSAHSSEVNPQALGDSGQRHLLRFAAGLGLRLVALRIEFGTRGLSETTGVDRNLDQVSQVLELARRLDVVAVAIRLGSYDPQDPAVLDALRTIAEHADRVDTVLAIETTDTPPQDLADLLREVGSKHLRVCLDPGALLAAGINPLNPIELFADQLSLCYIRDAEWGTPQHSGRETNLGAGALELGALLDQLLDAGYPYPLILRRSDSVRPMQDLAACKQILDQTLASRVDS